MTIHTCSVSFSFMYRVVQKTVDIFWTPFFFRFLKSSVRLLLMSVNNDVSCIFHENVIENTDTVFKLQLFEKVNYFFFVHEYVLWTLGSSNNVGPKFW